MMRGKKIFTIILAVILCIGSLAAVSYAEAQSAAEARADLELEMAEIGFETYAAWRAINYSSYDFYMNRFENPTRAAVKKNLNDPAYRQTLAQWRMTTFSFGQEVSYATKEIGYYETLLFDMLYDDTSKSFATEFADTYSGVAKQLQTAEKLVGLSSIKKIGKQLEELGWQNLKWPDNPEDQKKIIDKLEQLGTVNDGLEITKDVFQYIGYAKDVSDLIGKLVKVQQIANNSVNEGAVLADMKNKINVSANVPLSLSVEKFSAITSGSIIEEELVKSIMMGETIAEIGAKEVAGKVFDKTLDAAVNKCGLGLVNLGKEFGKFAANQLFNTDELIGCQYKMEAIYHLDNAMRSVLKDYEKAFISNPTEERAIKFNTALKMYYKLQVESLESYKEFVKAVNEKDLIKKIFKNMRKEKYNQLITELESVQGMIRHTMQSDRAISMSCYIDLLPELGIEAETMPVSIPEKVPPVLQPEEKEEALEELFTLVQPYSLGVVEGDITLTEDMEAYGNVYLKSGNINLNGHKLTIYGDLYQSGGSVTVAKGTLDVGGSYYMAKVATGNDGNLTFSSASNAVLSMTYPEDRVIVGENFVAYGDSNTNKLTAGTMSVAGDFTECGNTYDFASSAQHVVILNGTKPQKVSFKSNSSGFATLKIENPNTLTVKGYFRADKLETELDTLNIVSEEMNILNMNSSGPDINISGDVWKGANNLTFGANTLTIDGTLYQTTGNISLQKGVLNVKGTFNQTGGTIAVGAGTLNIRDNYYMARVTTGGDGNPVFGSASNAVLSMTYPEDKVIVGGDFVAYGDSNTNKLTAGTMSVAGDFTECGNTYDFASSAQHVVILNGTKPQKVSFKSNSSGFATLKIENPNTLTVKGYFRVDKLETKLDTLNIISEELNILNMNSSGLDINISGDVWKGANNLTFGANTLTIDGSLYQTTGNISLQKGVLNVKGTFNQTGGTIVVGAGTLNIRDNYYMAKVTTGGDGTPVFGSASNAVLSMTYPEDKVIIGGDFVAYGDSNTNKLTAGTMSVAGDFIECGNTYDFASSAQHAVILNGTKPQKVSFKSDNSGFATLKIENPNTLTVKGYFRADKLETELETLNIISEEMNILNVNSTKPNININGDVWKSGSSGKNLTIGGKALTINGSLYQTGGNISLQKGKLAINGSLYQSGGTMMPSAGTVKIAENYYIANMTTGPAGEPVWNSASAVLSMTYPEDQVIVGGDFVTNSSTSHSYKLTAGTLAIAGNFKQLSTSSKYNFDASGQHVVLLNGTKPQTVTFTSYDYSHFNILQLTQPLDQYTFNPNPCWIRLEEVVIPKEFKITEQPKDATVEESEMVTFAVKAEGEDLTYQWQYSNDNGVTWKSCTESGNNTDTLTVVATADKNGSKYHCVVTDANGEELISDVANLTVNIKVKFEITKQPQNQTVKADETATFTVKAEGEGLTYQWQYSDDNGVTWKVFTESGNNTDTLAVTATADKNGFQYHCVVIDVNGEELISSTAILTVEEDVKEEFAIIEQPKDVTAEEGKTVTFAVKATGEGLTYQWQYSQNGGKTWSNSGMTGNKTDTLTVKAEAKRDGQMYRCEIHNGKSDQLISEAATLTIKGDPVEVFEITEQPKDVTAEEGTMVTFSVKATGEGLTYQWQYSQDSGKSWFPSGMTGNKTNTLTVKAEAKRDGQMYRCIVKNAGGKSIPSDAATLKIGTEPVDTDFAIIEHPQNQSVEENEFAVLKVKATGNGLTYQWKYSDNGKYWFNSGMTGAQTDTLTLRVTEKRDGQMYRCVVKDSSGAEITSAIAALTIAENSSESFAIVSQPQNKKAEEGTTIDFSVEAVGKGLSYQWKYSNDGVRWYNASMAGANTATLTVNAELERNNQQYRCVITDARGAEIVSDIAVLTVTEKEVEEAYVILKQPEDITAGEGTTVEFKVEVSRPKEVVSYQWQYTSNGRYWYDSGMEGNQTNTLKVPVAVKRDGQQYRCIIKYADGTELTSSPATLTIGESSGEVFAIVKQPGDVTAAVGETAVFTVEASGEGLKYQWQYSNGGIYWYDSGMEGARTDSLSVEAADKRNGQMYRCVVTDAGGAKLTSEAATLKVVSTVKLDVLNSEITEKEEAEVKLPEFDDVSSEETVTEKVEASENSEMRDRN